jgi:SPP1 gp7 family putative phage head morphogenesis protein
MVQTINKKSLLALDTLAILYQAHAAGLKIYPEDQFVNYAEIDWELTVKEDQMVGITRDQIKKRAEEWISKISSEDDVKMDGLGLKEIFHKQIMDHIKNVWNYGQDSADQELERMNIASSGEVQTFASGKAKISDLTNEDAFEWYDLYSRQLASSAEDAVFHKMQPQILDALNKGTVSQLSAQLAADFGRYGSVRADIIARTESSKAFNWGRRYRFDRSPSLAGYRYSAIVDERTTPICRGLHGFSWEIDHPDLDAHTPPNHFRCRSVLVPISVYKEWTFEDPPIGWIRDLPEKDLEVFAKFMAAEWAPRAGTVIEKALPVAGTPAPVIPSAAPKKDPAPSPGGFKDEIQARQDLSDDDKEAITKAYDIIHPVKIDVGRRKYAGDLLKNAGIDDQYKISIRQLKGAYGQVGWYDTQGGIIDPKEFVLDSKDFRSDKYKIKTTLHEFYHAHFYGLKHDRSDFTGIGKAAWTKMEETATELSSQYMGRRILGLGKSVPSYPEYLVDAMPKLKQLDEFKNATTLEDFGERFMKYRFSSQRTAAWGPVFKQMESKGIPAGYYDSYDDWVGKNKETVVNRIFETIGFENRERFEDKYKESIRNMLDSKKSHIVATSRLIAMDELGVR